MSFKSSSHHSKKKKASSLNIIVKPKVIISRPTLEELQKKRASLV